ncbi:MAG: Ribosomal protein modification protein [Pseudomonadota bacterium]|jgi:ribosomal protein S6--L-glutamate ligase
MKIAILSREARSYSTQRLVQAATAQGHRPRVYDTLKFSIEIAAGGPDLYYRGKQLGALDGVIPRIGSSVTYFGTAVVRQFEQMGTFCLNSALAITNSRDKLKALQVLSKHDIGIPPTTFVKDRDDVMPAIERVGGAPVIIKVLEGTQGVGVILADSMRVAAAIVETLHSAKQNVLIQKFVAESKGRDIRALVVGDQVVAAMRRVAQKDEFRSNVHQGGSTEKVTLSAEFERTAVRAVQILGLRVAGVDMLEGANGPQVMEVNSSPGLEGIETITRIDVAGAMIDYLSTHINFPDMDLRQRLTAWKGYGVAEIYVGKKSGLATQTIASSGLLEQDIAVLELKSLKGTVVPNPKPTRELSIGDRLLCFGKLEAMRTFTAPRKRRKLRKLPKAEIDQATGPQKADPAR